MSNFASFGATSWADDEAEDHSAFQAAPARRTEHVIEEEERHHAEPEPRGGRYQEEERRPRRDSGEYQKREPQPIPEYGPFKCYVGNLPYQMNADDIAEFFQGLAVTDVHVVSDRETGRPKGFAYVTFDDRKSLEDALSANGEMIDNRPIRIDVASEKKGRDTSFGNRGGDRGFDRPTRDDRFGGDRYGGRDGGRDGGDRYGQRDGGDRYGQRDGGDRHGGRGGDRYARNDDRREEPKERPKLSLLPRTQSNEAKEASQRANIFGDAKPRDESKYLERKKAEADKPKVHDDRDSARGGRGGRGEPRAGGRGDKPAGRGDNKPAAPTRSDGDWVRGGAAAAVEAKAKPAKKTEAKKQPAKAAVFKPTAASTKVVNNFNVLGDDSDSD
ncbi:hypothetical protein SPRG_19104 [Saprolegnia parasitica CBS 223.65]|uniref:RRM domain-containing protein n=1 Tax=Saprolegnia parasitica (strain CBS 223.65) TaxID=695850 RepID=A0A067D5L1_SAPPC|nr:hypothetical protein SPRG_19104 [Saprolegnia parasitica CBS 223.65]KDO34287.1 hypothetical protein SPRG_19104 [Saprolegnia parasitica CBS 223.65]|eukprot:XP_012195299.1 hypothetical protein SPRG_19104 [Saprolegnia parasitica CBS 223.65]